MVREQPWLDGIATGTGTIRQFVAMPLGLGYTVEGQLTEEEQFGGHMWRDITGGASPPTPVSARTYTSAGLPWFTLYDETHQTIAPTAKLAAVKSVKQIDATKSTKPLQDDRPVQGKHVKHLWKQGARLVDDGEW